MDAIFRVWRTATTLKAACREWKERGEGADRGKQGGKSARERTEREGGRGQGERERKRSERRERRKRR